jgi:hypothetical protein
MQDSFEIKARFFNKLFKYVSSLNKEILTENGDWTIKGFIDVFKNIYTISTDTKIISKILEIHIFHKILKFAEDNNFKIVLADHQNYYPDIFFIYEKEESIKFAVDFKTTYRFANNPEYCNGFTLGSHGEYFINRTSKKNIQFPYGEYKGHFCLGIIYSRHSGKTIKETEIYKIDELVSITSVIKDFQFFVSEKWSIASDKSGSGNTANIGSINKISDIISGRGVFSALGEKWFDDYWMNYNKISIAKNNGKTEKIRNLEDFVKYRNGDISLIVPKAKKRKKAL